MRRGLSILGSLIDDNRTIFRYNPKRSTFYSHIKAEYLLTNTDVVFAEGDKRDVYMFLDKRIDSDDHFCKSIFTKGDMDYSDRQTVLTLLYKAKKHISTGIVDVLYQHKSYITNTGNKESSNAKT